MNSAVIKGTNAMKSTLLFSFLLIVQHGPTLRAETTAGKEVEWGMTLGCQHCHFGEQTGITICKGNCGPAASKDGKVFVLSGTAVPKDFKKGGDWLVKGTLSPDGKDIAVKAMAAQTPTPAELKDDQPAHPVPGAKPFTGPVAHSGAGLPTLTTADKTLYTLKSSKTASKSTSHTLTRIGGGDLTGNFTATGVTYEDDSPKWIVVESIQKMNAP
ncbi:MAG: hypothetical protein QOE70_3448 [Chthoniobacter sp.]|jgi:hypothetical protein|nr:hypothetical protein [Chthoniobacter sp.]